MNDFLKVFPAKTLAYRLWNLTTGQEEQMHTTSGPFIIVRSSEGGISQQHDWDLRRSGIQITAGAVTADDSHFVSGAKDGTLKIWNLSTGLEEHELVGHQGEITALAVTGNTQQVISASRDATLRVWDINNGQEIFKLEGHTGVILDAKVSGDDSMVASASCDNTLKVWDIYTGKNIFTGELNFHISADQSRSMNILQFTPDNKLVISGETYGSIRVWEVATGNLIRILANKSGSPIVTLSVTTDSKYIVSGHYDGILRVWDLTNGKAERIIQAHSGSSGSKSNVRDLLITHDGKRIISAGADNTIKISRCIPAVVESPESAEDSTTYKKEIYALAVTQDGKYAITNTLGHTITVYNLSSMDIKQTIGEVSGIPKRTISITPDGKYIISGSFHDLFVWNFATGKQEYTFKKSEELDSFTLTPDGCYLISGHDGTILFWNLLTGEQERILHPENTNRITNLGITPDGERLVYCSSRKVADPPGKELLIIYNINTEQEEHTLDLEYSPICLQISPDGKYVVYEQAGFREGRLIFVNIFTGVKEKSIRDHEDRIYDIKFTSDGRYLCSVAIDRCIHILDLASDHCMATFYADNEIKACAVTPDGKTFVIGDQLGKVHFLQLVMSK